MAGGKKSRRKSTRRSGILSDVLKLVNQGDYDYFEEYMIFGGTLEDLLDAAENPGKKRYGKDVERARQIKEAIRSSVTDLETHWSRKRVMRRLSLDKPTDKPVIKGLHQLEQLNAEGIAEALRETLDGPLISETSSQAFDRELDEYDAYFAREVLKKLPRIVNRISAPALADLDIQGIPNERVRGYFEEAHRCYLYSFPFACVVLCRAIVESAINEVLNLYTAQGRNPISMEGKTVRGPELKDLIRTAQQLGVLNENGAVCADDVRRSGNAAVHPDSYPQRFKQLFKSEQVDEVLANTREVLRELYGQVETR